MKDKVEHTNELNADFWNHRWKSGLTGWDIGYASPPLVEYMSQYEDKSVSILIPGCGNSYEAENLLSKGFDDITLIDISEELTNRLRERFKKAPQIKVIYEDFFNHVGQYDLILEQTFFCAQILERREEYVRHIASLLKRGGRLVGVLFNVDFGKEGPPFGGDENEYRKLFSGLFDIRVMSPCYNSIPPRAGSELFVVMVKK
ncbi:MAG: methyltransferase domain-containing protein [Saprospiraceae bacterium]|jgi:SAM-dependent methyltransferase|nr:methyltransferase domain-containing protein [Saprospiraceae bacterium]MCA0333194.1 TPMT family class I SAM-dependent methyltransferase [Bacteroidota bacterium]HQW94431.1 methyltransferase domain-containing protein [Saprospiraceae bacterium]